MSVKSAVEQLISDLEDNPFSVSFMGIILSNYGKASDIFVDLIDPITDPSSYNGWGEVENIYTKMSLEEKQKLYQQMRLYAELICFE